MKLRDQLITRCLAVIAVMFGLFLTLLTLLSFELQLSREREALSERASALARSLEAAAVNYALQSITVTDELAADLSRQLDGAVALYAPDGRLITGDAPASAPEKGLYLSDRRLSALTDVALAGRPYSLLVASDLTGLYHARRALLIGGAFLYFLMIALCAAALSLIARRLTHPLEQLTSVSRRLSSGELSVRAQVGEGAEMGEMARSFNRMADSLTGQIDRQQRFIANLTHEMKTPLTAVIGHADLIRSGRTAGEGTTLAAHRILTEAKRLNSLSLRLIDLILMEREEATLTSVNVRTILCETADALRPEAENLGISLSVSCPDAHISGDLHLIRMLLSNLADNALKSGASSVSLEGYCDGGTVILLVRDDGRGMDNKTLEKIAEPFYRADKSRSRLQGGAGLGLALCERIVRAHGTCLSFSSAPGQGTTVSVAFIRKTNYEKSTPSKGLK